MAITYNWKITDLERRTSDGYIFNVYYEVVASEGQSTSIIDGCVCLDQNDVTETFIPFEQLTEDIVLNWIRTYMGDEWVSIEQSLEYQLQVQRTPESLFGLPWANE
jgi:hypothetical protein